MGAKVFQILPMPQGIFGCKPARCRVCKESFVSAFDDRDGRGGDRAILSGPRIERNEELAVCFRDVFVLENGNASEIPHRPKNLLLEYSGLKMAYKLQIPFAVDVAQVTCGFIVPEWVEDLSFSVRTEKMRAYLLSRNHQQILDEMAALFGELLELSAYLLGHLDGLESEMKERAETAYARIQKHPALQATLEDFHKELRLLWETEGTWSGFDAFYALHECAIRLIAAYSVTLKPSGSQFNVSVPLEVIEQFADIQWIGEHANELAAMNQS